MGNPMSHGNLSCGHKLKLQTIMFASKLIRTTGVRCIRKMSGHDAATATAEAAKWKVYSKYMVGLCVTFGVYLCFADHGHEHQRQDLPYMKIRNKPYPWKECPDCNLFDGKCWKICRGEAVEEEHH